METYPLPHDPDTPDMSVVGMPQDPDTASETLVPIVPRQVAPLGKVALNPLASNFTGQIPPTFDYPTPEEPPF